MAMFIFKSIRVRYVYGFMASTIGNYRVRGCPSSSSITTPRRSGSSFSSPFGLGCNGNGAALFSSSVAKDSSSSSSVDVDSASSLEKKMVAGRSKILADNDAFRNSRSSLDKREYRVVELEGNKLRALLVSDKDTDVEAAAVHVKAGHFDDPEDRAGLAHFHEHMVFLGTEKYPTEGEFESFLSSNGGSANAYTDMEDTNYYFSITPSFGDSENDVSSASVRKISPALDGALDRFAQFFICPKFDESAVERELRAIDSEYLNSIMSDNWRNYQILKSACDQKHPFGKFGCGNYETLTSSHRCEPRQDLLNFWNEKYHSGNLRVCILGRASLDELQSTFEQKFEKVRSGTPSDLCKLPENDTSAAFQKKNLGLIREIKPAKSSQKVTFMFNVLPTCTEEMQRVRPHRVVSHLLGHESQGSLHQVLNDDGLIHGLSSGIGVDTSSFGLFSVTIRLTQKGMQNRDRVEALFWEWLELIKKYAYENKLEAYHEELRSLSTIGYRFKENSSPVDFCSVTSENMFYHEPDELLHAAYSTGDYDDNVIRKFLDRLTPKNSVVHVWDSDFETSDEWMTEKWYKGQYKTSVMSEAQLEKWQSPSVIMNELQVPGLNSFIPDDFSMKNTMKKRDQGRYATKLIDSNNLRMWMKADNAKYGVPKSYFNMHLTSPSPYSSPRTMTQTRIFERMFKDMLNCQFYDASVAGLSYGVSVGVTGINFKISGYSQKVPKMISAMFENIQSIIDNMDSPDEVLSEKYTKALESLHRETSNFNLDAPYEVANYNARLVLEEKTWTIPQYLSEMDDIKNMDVSKAVQECATIIREALYTKVCRVEALYGGNVDAEESNVVADIVKEYFLNEKCLGDEEVPRFRSMKLPTKDDLQKIQWKGRSNDEEVRFPLVYEELAQGVSENNNAVEMYLQIGSEIDLGYEGVGIVDIIGNMAYTSAFQTLRTQEQLGYIVSAYPRVTTGGGYGLSVVVQSSSKLPEELEERCEAWLLKFREEVSLMNDEEVTAEASSVLAQYLERDTRMSEEIGHAWGSIVATERLSGYDREPVFDRLETLAATIDLERQNSTITASELKTKMLEIIDNFFLTSSPSRRALSSRVYGQSSKEVYKANAGKPGYLQGHDDIHRLKLGMEILPNIPYWK